MLDISQIDDIWITANFKETQLRRMHPGQSVDVKVDAFGQTFHGYIESMPGATGAGPACFRLRMRLATTSKWCSGCR